MADRLTKEQRSRLMARIRGEDTQLELRFFAAMRAVGLRFATHAKDLDGTPDAVFRSARVAVFVEGDFWHGWQFSRWAHKISPAWRDKIARNRERDRINHSRLRFAGWRVVRVWKHQINGDLEKAVARVAAIVRSRRPKRRKR